MKRPQVKLSKYLSYLLRHGADEAGLVLDQEGFAQLDDVWKLIEVHFPGQYTDADLEQLLLGDKHGKKRLERRGSLLRAMYGHNRSLGQIAYEAASPPTYLYHGTTESAFGQIQKEGLRAMERQYVHLAVEEGLATRVAKRYTKDPVMLRIKALEAHEAGHVFYHPEDSHYLIEALPAAFIERL